MTDVRTGAQRVVEDPDVLKGQRIGLVTNFSAVMPDLGRNIDALVAAGVDITALLAPEHGLNGSAQAGAAQNHSVDPDTGLPILDTYLLPEAELDAMIIDSGADTLVFDMQDLGARFYTYMWSMFDTLSSAARTGRRYVVLDRPNPIGGLVVEGPGLRSGYESFVGRADIPVRHGMTIGEMALHLNETAVAPRHGAAELEVVRLAGWTREADQQRTGLPWVAPSPNMPTPDTALVFPGMALFEGTTLSEGRGTTRPFETVGAPWIDGRFAAAVRARQLPGVLVRDVWFMPTFHKFAGEVCRGIQLHVTDRVGFEPVRTALEIMDVLIELHPEFTHLDAGQRTDGDPDSYALDRLWGSDELRRHVAARRSPLGLAVAPRPVDRAYRGWSPLY